MIDTILTTVQSDPSSKAGTSPFSERESSIIDGANPFGGKGLFNFVSHLKQALGNAQPFQKIDPNTHEQNALENPTQPELSSDELTVDSPAEFSELLGQLTEVLQAALPTVPPEHQVALENALEGITQLQSALETSLLLAPPAPAVATMPEPLEESIDFSIGQAVEALQENLEQVPPEAREVLSRVIDQLQSQQPNSGSKDTLSAQSADTPSPLEQAIESLEKNLEKAPPEAREALTKVLEKLTEKAEEVLTEMPKHPKADVQEALVNPAALTHKEKLIQVIQTAIQTAPPEAQETLTTVLNTLQTQAPTAQERTSPLEQAVKVIQQSLETVSPQAQDALKQVIEKLQARIQAPLTLQEPHRENASKDATVTVPELEASAPSPKTEPQPEEINVSHTWRPHQSHSELGATPRQKAVEHIRAILEKVPPQAKRALEEVVEKLQSMPEKPPEKTFAKSIQQVQLEASFEKPQALAPSTPQETSSVLPEIVDIGTVDLPAQPENPSDTASSPSQVSGVSAVKPEAKTSATEMKNATDVFSLPQDPDNSSVESPQDQVIRAVQLNMKAGKKEITINLKPEELGEVRLKLVSNMQNEVSARLITETKEAKEALEKNLHQLFRSLEDNGVRVGKVTVVQAGAEVFESKNQQQYSSNHQQQYHSQQSSTQSQSQHQSQQHSQSAQTFMDFDSRSSNPFKDEGSSLPEGEASSILSFDTDVEGEEVQSTSGAMALNGAGSVDIRI